MPARRRPELFILLLFIALSMAAPGFSQPVPLFSPHPAARQPAPVVHPPNGFRPLVAEVCNNGIDDDGNGLADDQDFACYYASSTGGCKPSSVVWANSSTGLYWVDPTAGTSHYIAHLSNSMGDIAWASNGRLYGMSGNVIYEIDPYNGQILSAAYMPQGYQGINAMTGDEKGNLYLSMFTVGGPNPAAWVGKYSIATGQITLIADLSTAGVSSAGDLSFFNGYLWLSVGGNQLARIDPVTGALQRVSFAAPVNCDAYGLATLGDGYLYITDRKDLYRIDMTTMQASLYYTIPFGVNDAPYGLSTYAEHCNAPSCNNPSIAVTIVTGQPYCPVAGVALSAAGDGITGGTAVTWTLPDGTKANGPTLTARLPGTYTARYHNAADDCGHDTSFTLQFSDSCTCIPFYARVALPDDTELCVFDSLLLVNALHADGFRYRWQDGSTAPQLMAHGPGVYWADVSTWCGTVRDSTVIAPKAQGCDRRFRVPNAFSPGGGANGLFRPTITGPLLQYEFMVYNRWGQLLFRTTQRGAGWDGRAGGQPQAPGVYVWSCRYRFAGLPPAAERGTVVLLK